MGEGEILLAARLDPGSDAAGEDSGDGGAAARQPFEIAGPWLRCSRLRHYGYTGAASRPVRSLHPYTMFRFCTPFADPPLPRLSIALTQVARPVRGSETTVTSQKFDPTTARVVGRSPSPRTRTNGSPPQESRDADTRPRLPSVEAHGNQQAGGMAR